MVKPAGVGPSSKNELCLIISQKHFLYEARRDTHHGADHESQ